MKQDIRTIAEQVNWPKVFEKFSTDPKLVKLSRKEHSKIIGVEDHSILRVIGSNGEVYYAVKDGGKYDALGGGSFAKVKNAILVDAQGKIVPVGFDLAVRSATQVKPMDFPQFVADQNLDRAIARSKRSDKKIETEDKTCFVTRHYTILKKASCDLHRYIKNQSQFICDDREKLFDLAICITKLVYDLHKHNIAHRDIKPQNILLTLNDKNEIIESWLGDFDFANSNGNLPLKETELAGSPDFFPKILITKIQGTHEEFDIFALKRVLWLPKEYVFLINKEKWQYGHRVRDDIRYISYLAWIFPDKFIMADSAFRSILDTKEGSVSPGHSAAFILCALILEKNNLLSLFYGFYAGDDKSVRLSKKLIDIIIEAYENKPDFLFSDKAKRFIDCIARQNNNPNDPLDYYPLLRDAVLPSTRPEHSEATRVSMSPYALMPCNRERQYRKSKKPESCCAATCTML